MRTTILGLIAGSLVLVSTAPAQELGKKELEKLQGTWTFDSYEENGKPTPAADLKDKRIFFGLNQFMVKNGNELVQLGALKLDPLDGHRDIDAVVAAGPNKGNTMRGIYSLKGDILKVCIDPEGNERPKEFKTAPDSGYYLAVYKRVIPPGEEVDIIGRYEAESVQLTGEKQTANVEINRLGDCYVMNWSKGILASYHGIGVRKGDVLAVCWVNPVTNSKSQVGSCLYHIEKGPRLVGSWTILGGAGVTQRETLTPRKKKK